jgi:stage II sporulation protein P
MTISKEGDQPQILIYHTHSQETYADSVPGEESTSIVGVGEWLAQILTESYGYKVLHHTGKYDVEVRDDAYSNSLPAIEALLEEHPTIEVVIDLHRDEMPEEKKLLIDLDGRPTARFMFFNGLSRTRKTGDISYLYNENLGQNLAFSFQLQKKALEYYPGLTRKIYLKGYRYNMHLKPRTLLVELGAQNNTVAEAMNACDPLAHILDLVLSKN